MILYLQKKFSDFVENPKNKTPISFGAFAIIFFIYVIIFYHQFDDSHQDFDFGISPNPSANKA